MRTDPLIYMCQYIHSGFTPKHLTRIRPKYEDTPILAILIEVTRKTAWLSEDIVRSLPNGIPSIYDDKMSKPPFKK